MAVIPAALCYNNHEKRDDKESRPTGKLKRDGVTG